MKILIVEDNNDKRSNIKKFLQKRIGDVVFGETRSYSSGISEIYKGTWDLIILDMSLPTYDITHTETGGEMKAMAGMDILKRMKNRRMNTPVIVVTQFDVFGEKQVSLSSLCDEFRQMYSHLWLGTVSYDKLTWQMELDEIISMLDLQERK